MWRIVHGDGENNWPYEEKVKIWHISNTAKYKEEELFKIGIKCSYIELNYLSSSPKLSYQVFLKLCDEVSLSANNLQKSS